MRPSAGRATRASNSRRRRTRAPRRRPGAARARSLHLQRRVVAQVHHVVAVIGRIQVHDHQQVGRAFDASSRRSGARPPAAAASACATRFCTCTCAVSTSVPTAKVTVSVITPVGGRLRGHVEHVLDAVDFLLERRRDRLGDHLRVERPDRSRALPPRVVHFRILADRQVPDGNRTGVMNTIADMTAAKIGRSMKIARTSWLHHETCVVPTSGSRAAARDVLVHRHGLRRDRHAGRTR